MKNRKDNRTDEEKVDAIKIRFQEIMEILGLDLSDPSVAKTPARVARMYVNEIFSGLKEENYPSLTFMPNPSYGKGKANMVFVKVHFTSFCEHHFVPMMGHAYVAYVPKEKIIGLSKIPRIVKYFAKRPQLQERLTAQIADALSAALETGDVAVSLRAQHFCVVARGIEDTDGHTTTNDLRGVFGADGPLRDEFFHALLP